MKKLLFALLGMALSWPLAGASPTDVNGLRIRCRSGEDVTIMLDDNPVVRFADLNLVIATERNEINLPSDQVLKITYVSVDPGGITSAEMTDVVFSFSEESLSIDNLAPNTSVSIYTVDGRLVSTATTNAAGNAVLSLPGQSAAVYVVQTPTVSFKLRRP